MSETNYKEIAYKGLWENNPALVQLLGLCPLLAVSGSVVNALGMGIATTIVLLGSNIAVSLIRNQVTDAIRLPAFVMIIAAFTTCTELLMQAFTYELYQILGLFISLIVTNCVILGRADAFASRNTVAASAMDGLMMGLGFTAVLVLLGILREIIGSGTLFNNMHLLFGDIARNWTIHVLPEDYPGFLIAILPPGAFLFTGFLIAAKSIIDNYIKKRETANNTKKEHTPRRVRSTGKIS